MSINWEPLRKIIEDNKRFVLSSHVRPDADAIGSEIAMAGLLENMGKSVRIVNRIVTVWARTCMLRTPLVVPFLPACGLHLRFCGRTPQLDCFVPFTRRG